MTAVLSPDCAAGKCTACVGEGWDPDRDGTAPCPCACHHVTLTVLAAQEAALHDGGCCDPEDAA